MAYEEEFHKIKEIQDLKAKYEKEILQAERSLFDRASLVDTYQELYTFVKKVSRDQKHFNSSMLLIREAFLGKKRSSNSETSY